MGKVVLIFFVLERNSEIVILSIKHPFVSTYPFLANPMSILLCYEECYPWLLNNFIQIRGVTLENTVNGYIDYNDFYYGNCPCLNVEKISKKYIESKWKDVLGFIKYAVSQGSYVYMVVDTNCIKAYNHMSRIIAVHDIFVYGYSEEQEILYIADNFQGAYQFKECKYAEFIEGVRQIQPEQEKYNEFNGCIVLLSYISKGQLPFNPCRAKESIDDYLNCRPTKNWYTRPFEPWMEGKPYIYYYGRDNYKIMDTIIDVILENGNFPDATLQPLHLMLQHKNIMLKRILFMNENNFVNDDSLLLCYEKLSGKANILFNLLIKFIMKKDEDLKIRIRKIYNDVKCLEEFSLTRLLKSIRV